MTDRGTALSRGRHDLVEDGGRFVDALDFVVGLLRAKGRDDRRDGEDDGEKGEDASVHGVESCAIRG